MQNYVNFFFLLFIYFYLSYNILLYLNFLLMRNFAVKNFDAISFLYTIPWRQRPSQTTHFLLSLSKTCAASIIVDRHQKNGDFYYIFRYFLLHVTIYIFVILKICSLSSRFISNHTPIGYFKSWFASLKKRFFGKVI